MADVPYIRARASGLGSGVLHNCFSWFDFSIYVLCFAFYSVISFAIARCFILFHYYRLFYLLLAIGYSICCLLLLYTLHCIAPSQHDGAEPRRC